MRALVLAVLVSACSQAQSTAPAWRPGAASPSVVTSTEQAQEPGHVGVIAARESAVVVAEMGARVEEVFVEMGQWVKKDAPIARLDSESMKEQIASLHAERAASRATLRGRQVAYIAAKRRLRTEKRLYVQGVSAEAAVREARATAEQARAQVEEARAHLASRQAAVAAAEERVAGAVLRAPIAGRVSVLRIARGDIVAEGQLVVRVINPTDLAIRFALPVKQQGLIRIGQSAQFIAAGRAVQGVIREIAPDLEPPLQLVVARAEIAPGDIEGLQPGLVGTVLLATPREGEHGQEEE